MANYPKILPWEPHELYKTPKDLTSREDESPRSEGVQYTIGEKWRIIAFRINEAARPKWCPVVDVFGNESKSNAAINAAKNSIV